MGVQRVCRKGKIGRPGQRAKTDTSDKADLARGTQLLSESPTLSALTHTITWYLVSQALPLLSL